MMATVVIASSIHVVHVHVVLKIKPSCFYTYVTASPVSVVNRNSPLSQPLIFRMPTWLEADHHLQEAKSMDETFYMGASHLLIPKTLQQACTRYSANTTIQGVVVMPFGTMALRSLHSWDHRFQVKQIMTGVRSCCLLIPYQVVTVMSRRSFPEHLQSPSHRAYPIYHAILDSVLAKKLTI